MFLGITVHKTNTQKQSTPHWTDIIKEAPGIINFLTITVLYYHKHTT